MKMGPALPELFVHVAELALLCLGAVRGDFGCRAFGQGLLALFSRLGQRLKIEIHPRRLGFEASGVAGLFGQCNPHPGHGVHLRAVHVHTDPVVTERDGAMKIAPLLVGLDRKTPHDLGVVDVNHGALHGLAVDPLDFPHNLSSALRLGNLGGEQAKEHHRQKRQP